MKRSSGKWISALGAVLVGILFIASIGAADEGRNPFTQILKKLDQILAILNIGGHDGSHTLRWDQNLPAVQRFVVLAAFVNAAVLDKNTGLVWEQSPATTTYAWQDATYACANKNIGGQKGWRLPSIPELGSLIDPAVASPGPTLPPGHPFTNVQPAGYWSASTHGVTPTTAWVGFFGQVVGGPPHAGDLGSDNKANGRLLAWCVRGGMNADAY